VTEPSVIDQSEPVVSRTLGFAAGTACVFSSKGPDRFDADNEDAAGLFSVGDDHGVIVVADGAGGLPGGAQASWTAVRALGSAVASAPDPTRLRSAILDGFEQANREILDLGTGAATTMAVVEIKERRVRTFHVGDSVILVTGQRGKLKHVTVSHSPVSYAVEAGVLDERDALHHEDLNLVSNFVGSAKMRIDVGPEFGLARRDTVVVGTDGLFDNLHTVEICEAIRTGRLDRAARNLAAIGQKRMSDPAKGQPSKPDDLTFVAYRLDPL
jgi:serine/threonine protein phosphatase PrpC